MDLMSYYRNQYRTTMMPGSNGVWSGTPPQGTAQPGQPQYGSRPSPSVNYGAASSPQAYGGKMPVVGEEIGSRFSSHLQRAALLGAQQYAFTGTVLPGFRRPGAGGPSGFPEGRSDSASQQSRGTTRAGGGEDRGEVTRGELQTGPERLALNPGPRVHTVGPQKSLPSNDNPWGVTAHRQLGAGPSSQFDNNPARSDIRGELAEAAQAMGGTTSSPWAPPWSPPTSVPQTPTQRQDARTASKRKAGGNIDLGRILDR